MGETVRREALTARNMISIPPEETFEAVTSFPEHAKSCWIISDGKAGNLTQCVGVAEALDLRPIVKDVAPRGLRRFLAPYGGVGRHERFGLPGSTFAPPWPDIAIACGRLTTPYLRAIRRASGLTTYGVILLDPKTGADTADLFWVPQHDKRRGANVITTLTSPHRFSPDRIAELRKDMPRDIAAVPARRVAVLIGGPNGDYAFDEQDCMRLLDLVNGLAAEGVGLMITCSRRTPEGLSTEIERATAALGSVFWNGAGDNPYPHFLAHADAFVVTADSVNMVGEACATGRPVHVFFPRGGSAKFDRYHGSLNAYGATRRISEASQIHDSWAYEPLYSATVIAAEIARRYLRRRAVLGALM